MKKRHQVIVVGGGPVGVGLAVDLGLRGISCALVERRVGLSNIPKGQNLTQRTLEHFHRWGIERELRAKRILPPGVPSSGITAYKHLMSKYWLSPDGREIVTSYYSQANERLPQYYTEEVLRGRMASLPNVDALFGWSATEIEQDGKGVRAKIVEEGNSGSRVLEGDYLVGCDGGNSLVRGRMGVERSGTDFDQVMLLVVFKSRAFTEGLKRFPMKSTYRAMHPDAKGYWQFFGRIDPVEGWFFHAPVPADVDRNTYDALGLIYKVAGFEFEAEVQHVGYWDLRVAVAERYRDKRFLIAGDAAHTHPPYGGFGLNNGLEDAVNLGWKLEAVLKGWGSDRLLDSYSEERRPIFRDTGEDFIAARIQAEREFLERYSPERDVAEFERAWKEFESDAGRRVQVYEPNYEGSPVVWGPPGGVTSAHGSHSFKARPGHHLPPQSMSSGRNVFDELGSGFTLLALDADARSIAAFEAAAATLRMPLTIVRDTRSDGREAYEARLVLVRPDQFIAWTGDAAPTNVEAVLSRAIGHDCQAQSPAS
jgi:2-polyprenyl-6-methoxyphenol hydroxylase-like FAD-dependent oxidoreductase